MIRFEENKELARSLERKIFGSIFAPVDLFPSRPWTEDPNFERFLDTLLISQEVKGVLIQIPHNHPTRYVGASIEFDEYGFTDDQIGTPIEYITIHQHAFWSHGDYRVLHDAIEQNLKKKDFEGFFEICFDVARTILNNMFVESKKTTDQDIAIVCGPISTHGEKMENLLKFNKTIYQVAKHHSLIFDQMPFEEPFDLFLKMSEDKQKAGDMIMSNFYEKIFQLKRIKKFFFMHNWQMSVGARNEHGIAEDLFAEIVELPEDFIDNFWQERLARNI